MRNCFLVVFVVVCMIPRAYAVNTEIVAAQWNSIDTEALERAASESGAELTLEQGFDVGEGLHALQGQIGRELTQAVKRGAGSGTLLLVIVLFCETATALGTVAGLKRQTVDFIGVIVVATISLADVSSLIGMGQKTVEQINDFSNLLIPVVTACSAAGGAVTGSAARELAVVFFSDVLITLMNRVLIPFVYLYAGACTAAAAVGNAGLTELAKLLKWAVTSTLTTLLIAFTGYLSLTSVAAAGTDAATVKLTRTVISSMVPVVGGILSNATDTVLSGVALVKNIIGSFGVVAVLGFCVTPFVRLGVQYLVYRFAAVLSSVMGGGRVAKLIEDIAGAFSLVLGMTGTAALLVMIAVFAGLAVVTG